jgi:hypothetical protein
MIKIEKNGTVDYREITYSQAVKFHEIGVPVLHFVALEGVSTPGLKLTQTPPKSEPKKKGGPKMPQTKSNSMYAFTPTGKQFNPVSNLGISIINLKDLYASSPGHLSRETLTDSLSSINPEWTIKQRVGIISQLRTMGMLTLQQNVSLI